MKFSGHAWEQMRRRGVSRSDVRYCLQNRIDENPARGDCIKILGQLPSGKQIVIIVDIAKNQIVTAYPSGKR